MRGDHSVAPFPTALALDVIRNFLQFPVSNLLKVSGGGCDTCAIDASGKLRCFDDNAARWFGGFGQGRCNVPEDLGVVVQVSAGATHTCAIDASGKLRCFGENIYGQCNVPDDLRILLQ